MDELHLIYFGRTASDVLGALSIMTLKLQLVHRSRSLRVVSPCLTLFDKGTFICYKCTASELGITSDFVTSKSPFKGYSSHGSKSFRVASSHCLIFRIVAFALLTCARHSHY